MAISVLVVEDQADLRNAVRTLLEGDGYVVYDAPSPTEALAILATISPPCLVLWDTLTPTHDVALIDAAILLGVQVATLPVTASRNPSSSGRSKTTKRLTSSELVLEIVREHCPRTAAMG